MCLFEVPKEAAKRSERGELADQLLTPIRQVSTIHSISNQARDQALSVTVHLTDVRAPEMQVACTHQASYSSAPPHRSVVGHKACLILKAKKPEWEREKNDGWMVGWRPCLTLAQQAAAGDRGDTFEKV